MDAFPFDLHCRSDDVEYLNNPNLAFELSTVEKMPTIYANSGFHPGNS